MGTAQIDFYDLCKKLIEIYESKNEQDVFVIDKLKRYVKLMDNKVILGPPATEFVMELIDEMTNHTCKYRKNQGEKGCKIKGLCDKLDSMPSCLDYERLFYE